MSSTDDLGVAAPDHAGGRSTDLAGAPGSESWPRWVGAAVLVLVPLLRMIDPLLPVSRGVDSWADRIALFAAHPAAADQAMLLDVLSLLAVPAAVLAGLAVLPYAPRAGWLGLWAGLLGWAAIQAISVFDGLVWAAVGVDRQLAGSLLEAAFDGPMFGGSFFLIYMLGRTIATVAVGIGLWCSRRVPRWTAAALLAFSPVEVVGHVAGGVFAAAANLLLLVGYGACALLLVRERSERSGRAGGAVTAG